MSGFAVVYGSPDLTALEEMLGRITHRGGWISGVWLHDRVAMGQTYLRADVPRADPGTANVPLSDKPGSGVRICYDGEMGNAASFDVEAELGRFNEEQIVLDLYRRVGTAMFDELDDAVFAFVISDGRRFLAARDLVGIKTLFYGREGDVLYFASEVKALIAVTEDVHEFPPGHYMDETGRLRPFAELPESPLEESTKPVDELIQDTHEIVSRGVRTRLATTFDVPTGSLLSGGLDSSVVTQVALEVYKGRFGDDVSYPTFGFGLGESEDILSARLVAQSLGTDHHELIVDLDEIFESLPEVIYYLESFDPSLVRSSVANFLVGRYAKQEGIEVLLSGEGGDEMFCGYAHMKSVPEDELFQTQMESFASLHNNAALRLDRMNQCHSIRVIAPLISGELFQFVQTLPPEYKLLNEDGVSIEKWILRKAFEPYLPEEITNRTKQEFSQGAGVASLLPERVEVLVTDDELEEVQSEFPFIRSKEELYYFRLFGDNFGYGLAVESVGQWIPD